LTASLRRELILSQHVEVRTRRRRALKDALIGDTHCDRDHRPELTIMLTLWGNSGAPSQVARQARFLSKDGLSRALLHCKNPGIIIKEILTPDSRQITAHRFY
jgi:hypothetical protein